MKEESGILDRIEGLFGSRGAEAYLGEAVTTSEHMLQCAALAEAMGASEPLVAAALLHDIGHFTSDQGEYSPDDKVDRRHEEAGAAFLHGHFPPLVVESVRLHVAAKRYLCGASPVYHVRLSAASRHSLSLQGGPMDTAERADFEEQPFHREAIQVRLWDDSGKVTDVQTPSFAEFLPLLRRVSLP
jgi:phosphonate degradation associated HDIG domain protein